MLFGYLSPILAQNIFKDEGGVLGKVCKRINEIEKLKNYKEEEGIVIDVSKNKLGFSRISDGHTTLILFESFIPPSSRKILAILDIGKLEKGNQIVMARCRLNSNNDNYIVAIVKSKPTKDNYFKKIIKAWKINEKTARFFSIPTKGIDCFEDGDESD